MAPSSQLHARTDFIAPMQASVLMACSSASMCISSNGLLCSLRAYPISTHHKLWQDARHTCSPNQHPPLVVTRHTLQTAACLGCNTWISYVICSQRHPKHPGSSTDWGAWLLGCAPNWRHHEQSRNVSCPKHNIQRYPECGGGL